MKPGLRPLTKVHPTGCGFPSAVAGKQWVPHSSEAMAVDISEMAGSLRGTQFNIVLSIFC